MPGTAARQALSIPDVVSLVVDRLCHLVTSSPSPADPRIASLPVYYSTLLVTSLVSRPFYVASQELLLANLTFVNGTEQLRKYLSSLESKRPGQKPFENHVVRFVDTLPFKEGKEEEGAKWDFELVRKVLESLQGCRELDLGFMGQAQLPAKWLTCESLKGQFPLDRSMPVIRAEISKFAGLFTLRLGSPLDISPSSSSLKPSFAKLYTLAPVDHFPKLSRDWTASFSFLVSSHEEFKVQQLNLSSFPRFMKYLVPTLYPVAWSLIELDLPHLESDDSSNSSSNTLFVFAQACTHLERLSISHLSPRSVPSLCTLLAFQSTLDWINFDFVEGSLGGHYDWTPRGETQDVWSQLLWTLEKMETSHEIKGVQVGKAKWFLPEHQKGFEKLVKKSKMGLSIEVLENGRTDAEVRLTFPWILHCSPHWY